MNKPVSEQEYCSGTPAGGGMDYCDQTGMEYFPGNGVIAGGIFQIVEICHAATHTQHVVLEEYWDGFRPARQKFTDAELGADRNRFHGYLTLEPVYLCGSSLSLRWSNQYPVRIA
jgi:hypothetical protein